MNNKGVIVPLVAAVVTIACFCVVGYYKLFTKTDSPVEKAAEEILHEEGIDINFATKES